MNELIIASFSLIATLAGVLIVNNKTLYRMEPLEKKVEQHNNAAACLYHAEDNTTSAHHRIDRVEKIHTRQRKVSLSPRRQTGEVAGNVDTEEKEKENEHEEHYKRYMDSDGDSCIRTH